MNLKNLAMWGIIVFLTIGLYNMFKNPQSNIRGVNQIIFSDFLTSVENGEVLKVDIQGNNIKGVYSNGNTFSTYAPNDPNLIEKLSDKFQIPIAYAGGVSSVKITKQLFNRGVDKVYLNSSLFKKINIIEKVSKIYGSQSICALIQTRKIENKWEVFADAGRNRTGIILKDWIKILVGQGVGEIAIISIDHDGMHNGVDSNLINIINEMNLKIPLLYGGGIKDKKDIDLLSKYNFQGALVSHVLHFKKKFLTDLKAIN